VSENTQGGKNQRKTKAESPSQKKKDRENSPLPAEREAKEKQGGHKLLQGGTL